MLRRALPLVLLVVIAACSKDSPTSPTPPPAVTRIISLSGSLNFGPTEVGSTAERTFQIHNSGSDPLTVTSLSSQNPNNFPVSWASGVIPPGGVQSVTVRFQPTDVKSYDTVLRVNGNQTAGSNGINIEASGVRTGPLWTRSGSGNMVFDMPSYVARVRIRGEWNRRDTSNFIVRIGGRLAVNEILREPIVYEGVHLTNGGGVVEITNSAQITWSFTEER
jgi:hypothetical protein